MSRSRCYDVTLRLSNGEEVTERVHGFNTKWSASNYVIDRVLADRRERGLSIVGCAVLSTVYVKPEDR